MLFEGLDFSADSAYSQQSNPEQVSTEMNSTSGKPKLFLEGVKDRHTSHWDLDMLSWEELDAMLGEGAATTSTTSPSEDRPRQPDSGHGAGSGD